MYLSFERNKIIEVSNLHGEAFINPIFKETRLGLVKVVILCQKIKKAQKIPRVLS